VIYMEEAKAAGSEATLSVNAADMQWTRSVPFSAGRSCQAMVLDAHRPIDC